jgi:hypothetical protein
VPCAKAETVKAETANVVRTSFFILICLGFWWFLFFR